MKPESIRNYEELYEVIWSASSDEDRERLKKLCLDEVGARAAWKVIKQLLKYKGFEESFWEEIEAASRCVIFNDIANIFRREPLERDWDFYYEELEAISNETKGEG